MWRCFGVVWRLTLLVDEAYGIDQKPVIVPEDFAKFLIETWHKDRERDRSYLLNFERTFEDMLNGKDARKKYVSPSLNSYHRMLFHRMADVWGFEHSPDVNNGVTAVAIKVLPDSHR